MNVPTRFKLGMLGFGLAAGLLTLTPAWSQSQAPTHWGWYTPKPVQNPAPRQKAGSARTTNQPANPSTPPATTTMQGGDTSGNRPAQTVSSSSSTGPGGEVQTQVVSVPGINGGSKTLVDQETQTIQLNANTTRTITKIYGQGADGNRELIGVNQTDTTDLGDGKSKSVTKQSHLDVNNQMTVTREVDSETVPSGPNSSTTNATVLTPGAEGQMTPSQKMLEVERKGKNSTQTTSTLMMPDVNGGWTTTQKTDTVVSSQPNGQQTENKKVYTVNADGNLSVSQQVVTQSWKDKKTGQEHQEVSTYATTPGGTMGPNGVGLSLVQRVSTVKSVKPNGTIETQQTYQQSSPVSMSQGLKITGQVIKVATPTKSGALSTSETVYTDNGNGQLQQVSAFTGQEPKPQSQSPAKQSQTPAKTGATNAKQPKPASTSSQPNPQP
jgi:hypothetical protein